MILFLESQLKNTNQCRTRICTFDFFSNHFSTNWATGEPKWRTWATALFNGFSVNNRSVRESWNFLNNRMQSKIWYTPLPTKICVPLLMLRKPYPESSPPTESHDSFMGYEVTSCTLNSRTRNVGDNIAHYIKHKIMFWHFCYGVWILLNFIVN